MAFIPLALRYRLEDSIDTPGLEVFLAELVMFASERGWAEIQPEALAEFVLRTRRSPLVRDVIKACKVDLSELPKPGQGDEKVSTSALAPETNRIIEGAARFAAAAGRPLERLRYSDVLVALCDSPVTAPLIERLNLTKLKILYFISHRVVLPDTVELALPEIDRHKPVWVRIQNDDFTPMTVVSAILSAVFSVAEGDAQALMMRVHTEGQVYLGPFGHDEAFDLARHATAMAQEGQHPLRITLVRSQRQSLLARHWRGEVPLAQSLWEVALKGTLCFGALGILLIGQVFTRFSPQIARLAVYAFAGITLVFMIWQSVGVWRAATRCTHRWSTVRAGTMAQAVMGLVLLALLAAAPAAAARLHEVASSIARIASLPPLEIEVSGTDAVYVRGGIRRGAARLLKRTLDERPSVRLIILESPGGVAAEGSRLQRLIRERRLNTLVEADCFSACAFAFLGGVERYISIEGRLGFHQAASAFGFTLPRALQSERALLDSGVPPWFAERAYQTPPSSIWIPTEEELIDAGVVHEVWD